MEIDFNINSKREFFSLKLDQLHTKKLFSVEESSSVSSVIDIFHKNKIGSVLVMNGPKLQGLVSERDIIDALSRPNVDLDTLKTKDIMTSTPKVLTIENTFEEAMLLMNKFQFRHVPITDNSGVPISILSIKEVLEFILFHV